MKTSELTGAALDWAVAKCEGLILHKDAMLNGIVMEGWYASGYCMDANQWIRLGKLRYSSDWSQMGPIIEREQISIKYWDAAWTSSMLYENEDSTEVFGVEAHGENPLTAAARCYVVSKLGDTVDVPEELC